MIGFAQPALLAAGSSPLDRVAAQAFLAIAVIVVVARLVGLGARKLGQPVVLGEILAGISLGPSVLGLFPGNLPDRLFPLDTRPYLKVAAELGLVIFMFVIGLEIDPAGVRRSGRRAVTLSLSSIAVPMVLGGLVLAPLIHGRYGDVGGEAVAIVPFSLFMGVAMSGTAFAVLARILTERNMFRIPLGMLAIACAAIDDIIVFALLTMVVAIASSGDLGHVPVALAELAVFVIVLFGAVRPLLDRFVLSRYRRAGRLGPDVLAVLLAGALASAYVANRIGLASLIGAFLFGAAVPRRQMGALAHELSERVEGVSVVVLLPVFFVVTGLGVDIKGLGWSGLPALAAVLATACIGKFVGGGVAARLSGMSTRQSLALATLMNTRGLTELVILNIGRSAGLIDGPLFTMMVIMAILTTVAAGPVLGLVYPARLLARDIADADRRASTDGARYRVAVVLPTGAMAADGASPTGSGSFAGSTVPSAGTPSQAHGPLTPASPDAGPEGPAHRPGGNASVAVARAVQAALAAVGPERPAAVSIYALLEGNDLGRLSSVMAATQPGRRMIEAAGLTARVTVRFAGHAVEELIEELRGAAPDAVVVPWAAELSVVQTIQALADADLADLLVVAGPPRTTSASPADPTHLATDPSEAAAVIVDLRTGEAAAVAEHAARLARARRCGLVAISGARAGRNATEQLERAGFTVSVAAAEQLRAEGHAPLVTGLVLGAGGLDVTVVATLSAATRPVTAVKGRLGERLPLAERVPATPTPAETISRPT
ncbi:MAG: cation:proton antiporter [Acidimicrobiales bacterium]